MEESLKFFEMWFFSSIFNCVSLYLSSGKQILQKWADVDVGQTYQKYHKTLALVH